MGQGGIRRLVHTKTFSTHDEPKICHVVRKSGVFTHGKNSHDGVGCIKTSLCLLTRPAGVEPLEVRFAHPVRLSPATWFIFCDSFKMSIWYRINVLGGTKCLCKHSWYRLKRFPRTKHVSKALSYRLKRFRGTEFRFYTTGKRDRNKRHEREARSDV